MYGILRVQVVPQLPRARAQQVEDVCGMAFQVEKLRLCRTQGFLDRRLLRRSLKALAAAGVTQVVIPQDLYIKQQLQRYNMTEINHTALMRGIAPQIIDYLLQRQSHTAVAIYAGRLDNEVLAAVHHAARYYDRVMLELGRWNEIVCDQLLAVYGLAALPGIVPMPVKKTAALWFDCPPQTLCHRMERMISVALCAQEAPADYNDVRLKNPRQSTAQDTDWESVMSAVVAGNAAQALTLQMDCLAKK